MRGRSSGSPQRCTRAQFTHADGKRADLAWPDPFAHNPSQRGRQPRGATALAEFCVALGMALAGVGSTLSRLGYDQE